tara:strand:+ start:491 stop:733 length:243 start_codon:yes stop_codon:yes gene_type:complete
MARRFITPMGRHKPVRSSWQAMDSKAFTRSYEPETRPEFRVYVTGQADAAQRDYEARLKREADLQKIADGMARLRELGLA